MQTRYEFYKSLKKGDVIESDKDLTTNQMSHSSWNRFGRVSYIGVSDIQKDGDEVIGIRIEGIDPSVHECCVHVAKKSSRAKPMAKMASGADRRNFMCEYIKTRTALVEHRQAEIAAESKRLAATRKDLNAIAKAESIDVKSLKKDAS